MKEQFFKKNKMRMTAIAATSVLTLALLSACGGPLGTTDSPLKDYRDLGPSVPKAEVPPPPPPTPTPEPYEEPTTQPNQVVFPRPQIVELDTNNKEIEVTPRFYEGERREYLVKTQVFANNVSYRVELEGWRTGNSDPVTFKPLNDPERPGYYVLSWTPAVGTLARESSETDIRFRLKFVITNENKEALPQFVRVADGANFAFTAILARNTQSPRILQIKLESDVMQIGDKNLVTVAVTDPSAGEKLAPEIFISDESGMSSEKQVVKLAKYIELVDREFKPGALQQEQESTSGVYYFRLMLDTEPLLSKADSLKPETEGRFVVRVLGATSGKVTAATKSLKLIKKSVAVPLPTRRPDPNPAPAPATAPATEENSDAEGKEMKP